MRIRAPTGTTDHPPTRGDGNRILPSGRKVRSGSIANGRGHIPRRPQRTGPARSPLPSSIPLSFPLFDSSSAGIVSGLGSLTPPLSRLRNAPIGSVRNDDRVKRGAMIPRPGVSPHRCKRPSTKPPFGTLTPFSEAGPLFREGRGRIGEEPPVGVGGGRSLVDAIRPSSLRRTGEGVWSGTCQAKSMHVSVGTAFGVGRLVFPRHLASRTFSSCFCSLSPACVKPLMSFLGWPRVRVCRECGVEGERRVVVMYARSSGIKANDLERESSI